MSAAVALLVWSAGLAPGGVRAAAASTVSIDFENAPAGGSDPSSGGQFTIAGVDFSGATVVDFTKTAPPLDDFAHSGSNGVEACQQRGCRLTMSFPTGETRVSLFVGLATTAKIQTPLPTVQVVPPRVQTTQPRIGDRRSLFRSVALAQTDNVALIAFDAADQVVATEGARITPGNPSPSIDRQLEVRSATGAIRAVQLAVAAGVNGILAADDLEFEPAEAALAVTPRSVDFGRPQSGAAPHRTVTVESTGNVDAVVTALAFAGTGPADYGAIDEGCVRRALPPSSRCTIEIERLSAAATGPDAALVVTDATGGRHAVRLVAAGAATPVTRRSGGSGGTGVPPAGAGGSSDPLRTVVIAVLGIAALAAVGTAAYLWLRPTAPPLHVVVLPAATVQTFGGDGPPTTVTVRFDPSTGVDEWIDRSPP